MKVRSPPTAKTGPTFLHIMKAFWRWYLKSVGCNRMKEYSCEQVMKEYGGGMGNN
jgi:hypothetical protein